ncbi:MAG: segregation/condensation protein A [Lachnospiraceae bacterium]|nr:segregation/condensation protein A [Lachnospiraceae bacterium]
MDLSFKLEAFEGPLDLLLQLIEKNKVNIYDIPIAMITDQYMEVLNELKQYPMDNISEFLVMAATLLRIKSQMLLPVTVTEEEEAVDPRAELVERLLEYKMYKYASLELKDRQIDACKHLYRKENLPKEVAGFKEEVSAEEVTGDVTLQQLNDIFKDLMKRQENRIDPIRSKFGRIEKEEVNFKEKVIAIQEYGLSHKKFSFRRLLEKAADKIELIVTFLGILELIHMGRVCIRQLNPFDDFEVEYLASDVVPIESFT